MKSGLGIRLASHLSFCVAVTAVTNVAHGQAPAPGSGPAYPSKVIRIVTAGVGGGSDYTARVIAPGISGPLGQPVVVENRGGGVIPGEVVSKSAPDGYTILVTTNVHWIGPYISTNVPYDPVKDFAPVSLTNRAPNILVVHPALPVKNVRELIALAKARPGALSFSTGGNGSATHLAPELFKSMTGINMVRIPYKNGGAELADLLGGHVQLAMGSTTSMIPPVRSGKLRALGIGTLQRSALAPDLPTIAESGVPGYEAGVITGVFAPARTPVAIVNRLSQEIARLFNIPETRERLLGGGVETVGSTPEQFAAAISADMSKWGKLIKDAGIRAD
jgi:tripartite-type tricarboxylate transporter receptor subunit TctC